MRTTRLIAVLVGMAAITMAAADAQAIYHPGMGTFLQRDPGAAVSGPARIGAARPAMGGGFAQRDPMPAGPTRIVTAGIDTVSPAVGGTFAQRDSLSSRFAQPSIVPGNLDQTGLNAQYADGPNLYQLVGSNPVNWTDPSGLKRYKVKDGLHRYLVVEVWDKDCCKVTGYRQCDMGVLTYTDGSWTDYPGAAWNTICGITVGGVGRVYSSDAQKPGSPFETIDSTCAGDKKLLDELQGLADRKEKIYYQVLWRNCWGWVWQYADKYKDER